MALAAVTGGSALPDKSVVENQLDEWLRITSPIRPPRDLEAAKHSKEFLLQHLPRVSFKYNPILVPWMGSHYTGTAGNFLRYPQMMGFNVNELREGSFGAHSDEEGLAFLQSWLFFGLVREALPRNCEIDYEWWICNYGSGEDGAKTMMSPLLPQDLYKFSINLRHPVQRPPWEYWLDILRLTLAVAEKFDQVFDLRGFDEEEPAPLRITWSILTFGQIMTNIAMDCYGINNTLIEQWPDSAILDHRLESRQWCPYLTARLKTSFSMDSLYYISLLDWYNPTFPYSTSSGNSGLATKHARCTFKVCHAENIDYILYRTAHTHRTAHVRGKSCDFHGPPMSKIYEILDRKEIPVLVPEARQSHAQQNTISLHVSNRSSIASTGYVAISHVWADGLGNQLKNELPQCQLRRIVGLLQTLTGSDNPPFWIDTCCVPRDTTQRWKALDLMNDTYRLSSRVLVLDDYLQQFSSHGVLEASLGEEDARAAGEARMGIALELLCRIVCSPWTTRLWTLPEGQVGPLLYFQFADRAVELGELYQTLNKWPFVGTSLPNNLRVFLVSLRPRLTVNSNASGGAAVAGPSSSTTASDEDDLGRRFRAMLHAIEWRSTSRPIDEVLCMSIQLQLDVSLVQRQEPANRMREVLGQVKHLPADLMFTHGERIQTYPFRWAPQSLLGYKNDFSFVPAAKADTQVGRQTEHGLLVQYPLLHLKKGELPDNQFLYFSTVVYNPLLFSRTNPAPDEMWAESYFGMMIDVKDPRTMPSWSDPRIAAIFRDRIDRDFFILLGPQPMDGPSAMQSPGKVGLVVVWNRDHDSSHTRGDGVLYVIPLLTVVIFELPTLENTPRLMPGTNVELWSGMEVPTMTFCVG